MIRCAFILAIAILLGGCSAANMVLPVSSEDIKTCLDQGTYYDRATRQCASVQQPSPPSPEQQARQAEFEKRVQARAARCTTGNREMCRVYAQQEEVRTQVFCTGDYGSAAHNILGYKAIGWPMEMTGNHVAKSYPTFTADLLIRLVRAGYSEKWRSPEDFQKEAQLRCLNGNPF